MGDRRFPIDDAMEVMGPNAQRYRTDRARGKVFGTDLPVDGKAEVSPVSWGAGAVTHMTFEALSQAALGVRLIAGGLDIARAYRIGGFFAYFGQGGPSWWGDSGRPAPDPLTYRQPARLFAEGRTFLAVAPQTVNDRPGLGYGPKQGFAIFSDADTNFQGVSSLSVQLGGTVDGLPRLVLSVSDIYRKIGRHFDLPLSVLTTDVAADA